LTAAIDESNIGHAVDLLRKGFPALCSRGLEAGLQRWMQSPGHRSGEEPIGHLLTAEGRYVGIGLTAVSECHDEVAAGAGPRRRVNLASWYVEPDHRLRLPVLLRGMLADPTAIYTDLTPAPMVLPILDRLGFTPLNDGVLLVNLALAACGFGTGAVVTVRDRNTETDTWLSRMVEDHLDYGCIALDLEHEGSVSTLVLKPVRLKRIPLIELIYCEDDKLLRQHMPAVARTLLKAGHFGLLIDSPVDRRQTAAIAYTPFRQRRRRLVKNAKASRRIDHTYSELVFFGP
jgi:hypothetical protein